MHGIVGLLPGGEVAAGVAAVRRRNLQSVIPANVTGKAGHGGVFIGEREASGAVIKFSVRPFGDGMAGSALRRSGRKTGGNVIRNGAAHGGRAGE